MLNLNNNCSVCVMGGGDKEMKLLEVKKWSLMSYCGVFLTHHNFCFWNRKR